MVILLFFLSEIELRTMSQPGYTIAPVQKEDADDIMDLLKRTFFIDEPLNQAIGLCENETCTELEEYCSESMLKGLSFKAIDADGNIIGVMISGVCPLKVEDDDNLLSQAERCQNPKFKRILYILARREEGSKLHEQFPDDEHIVDVKVAATDPSWRRRGIMKELVRVTEKATKQRGIRLLRMDTSSAYSAMSAERLGFTCYYDALYKDITMDGRPIIVPEPPHVNDRVYIKTLFEKP
ncbi:dopamine N-acetyltransferase isoform X1 [Manduca sexta]|uniref:dopamine N-acetyltransferase isoform X1 n=2 Tax=Manduca sexta TaxID=7130 RepID=UPI0018904A13|nr:dopamine N-acetyltransferase isoform X1 [Manduca sexta]